MSAPVNNCLAQYQDDISPSDPHFCDQLEGHPNDHHCGHCDVLWPNTDYVPPDPDPDGPACTAVYRSDVESEEMHSCDEPAGHGVVHHCPACNGHWTSDASKLPPSPTPMMIEPPLT